jgi:hypothetical protein
MKQAREKQERIIESVRQGLEGDRAVAFVRENGYAMTSAGIARHLHQMGGRGRVQELIDEGHTNLEVLQYCFPEEDLQNLHEKPPTQEDLFPTESSTPSRRGLRKDLPLYETTKMALKVPADLYEAIRLAAKAERKTQNQLVVEILTTALSRMPDVFQFDDSPEEE